MERYLEKNIEVINEYLQKYIDGLPDHIPENLKSSISYSLFAGGKRIRPILLIEFSKTFGKDISSSIPLACAVEMIHTYSLIHDDLPAMDNDDYRRGKLTNHKVFGEDMAILTGDALLHYAFEIMLTHSTTMEGNYVKAIGEIASASGVGGMVTGQVADMMNERENGQLYQLDFINFHKTGQLIKASVLSGAIVQGANEDVLRELREYSKKIGLAFQIVDDLLDVIGDEKKLGKKLHSDIKNHKKTYVDMYGIDKCKSIVEDLKRDAIYHLQACGADTVNTIGLTEFICRRDY